MNEHKINFDNTYSRIYKYVDNYEYVMHFNLICLKF